MDFIDDVRMRSGRFRERLAYLETEEATKTALVLPFLEMMGYSIFDPTEVVPEFTADVGTKKGEKVDYALMQAGKPIVVIEVKKYGSNLSQVQMSQLLRYFTVTDAHFGILTDGVVYRFFSDLDQPNVMDPAPFFQFNMLEFTDNEVEELKRFTKSAFDLEETLEAAAMLKYTKGMKQVLARQLNNPDPEFTRLLAREVYSKILTKQAMERFTEVVKQAFREFINDRINATLKTALAREASVEAPEPESEPEDVQSPIPDDRGIVTTAEELEGFEIVKDILKDTVDLERVVMRDTMNYCGILLDDNNRKSLCRLRFNAKSVKRIGVFDEERREQVHVINSLEEIRGYADQIRATANRLISVT